MEWKSSVWGEGHIWDIHTWAFVDSRGHQLKSPYWLSSWVTFLLRVQPGVDLRRWGGKRAQSLLPLPGSPSCASDSHGNAKGTKISQFFLCRSKAAVLSRGVFWLVHVLQFPLSEAHSLWVLAGFLFVIWSCFLQVFTMIFLVLYAQPVMCEFSVQTK